MNASIPSAETDPNPVDLPVPPFETATVLPLLEACTRLEQAFILELVANPTITQIEAYRRAGYRAAMNDVADANALPPLELAGLSPVWRDPKLAERWNQM